MKVWDSGAKWTVALGGARMGSLLFILTWGCELVFNFEFQVWTNETLNANLELKWLSFIKTIFSVHVFHLSLDKIHMKPCSAWLEREPRQVFLNPARDVICYKKSHIVAIQIENKVDVHGGCDIHFHICISPNNLFGLGVCFCRFLFTECCLKSCSLLRGKYSYRK